MDTNNAGVDAPVVPVVALLEQAAELDCEPFDSPQKVEGSSSVDEAEAKIGVEETGAGASSKCERNDFAEEDACLLAHHFLGDEGGGSENPRERDPERYIPQLMDVQQMQELRSSLLKSERQIQTCGRMREFTPRKHTPSQEVQTGRRANTSFATQNLEVNTTSAFDCIYSTDGRSLRATTKQPRTFLTAASSSSVIPEAKSAARCTKKENYAVVLRRELQQLRGERVGAVVPGSSSCCI